MHWPTDDKGLEAFAYVFLHGTDNEVREFTASLDDSTREKYATSCVGVLQGSAIMCCIHNADVHRLRLLFELGARAPYVSEDEPDEVAPTDDLRTEISHNRPMFHDLQFTAAVTWAVRLRCLPLLSAMVSQIRVEGNLTSYMQMAFNNENIFVRAGHAQCIKDVIDVDSADALALLLDNGWRAAEWSNLSTLIAWGVRPELPHVHYAAANNAVACLRLLRERLNPTDWRRMIRNSYEFAGLCRTPLASALEHRCTEAYEFLLPEILTEPPEATSAPPLPVAFRAAAAAEHLSKMNADTQRDRSTRARMSAPDALAAAQAVVAGWDPAAAAETCIVLALAGAPRFSGQQVTLSDLHPLVYAVQRGCLRAFAALTGYCPELLTKIFAGGVLLAHAPTAAVAEAVLRAYTVAEAARLRTATLGEEVDEAALRRRFATGGGQEAGSFAEQLVRSGSGAAACLLLQEGPAAFTGTPHVLAAIPSAFESKPAEGLQAARACIAALAAHSELAAAMAEHSHSMLRAALRHGQLALAQLYYDSGADVYAEPSQKRDDATESSLFTASMECEFEARCSEPPGLFYTRPVHSMELPAEADAAALSVADTSTFTSEGIRAHAAATDASEASLLAALLQNPDLLNLGRLPADPARERWIADVTPALSVRWLWERMCERDAARAQVLLAAHGAEMLHTIIASLPVDTCLMYVSNERALDHRRARMARFFTARGARLPAADVGLLGVACRAGHFELAWALLGALPADALASVAGLVGGASAEESPVTEIVAAVVRLRCRLPRALVEALVAAGAPVTLTLIVEMLCGPPDTPGALAETLRGVIEAVQNCQPSRRNAP
jgi:hypothetical protein